MFVYTKNKERQTDGQMDSISPKLQSIYVFGQDIILLRRAENSEKKTEYMLSLEL